jgi:Putative exopolysaccharide Exporter (EPS-E)
MSIEGYNLTRLFKPIVNNPGVRQAVLYIVPSLATTSISMLLFSLLRGFNAKQMNHLSITMFTAIIISLTAAAGIQLLIYRIIEDHEYFTDDAARRGIKTGILCTTIISLILLATGTHYFLNALNFSGTDFLNVIVLTLIYSAIWVITSAFWAAEKNFYPAALFGIGYAGIFACTYGAYQINHGYTLAGFTMGSGFLLVLCWLGALRAFGKRENAHNLRADLRRIGHLAASNKGAILFNILYVIALFLDKIFVWSSQGQASGEGLKILGPYTEGAFLGLIPMLSIGVVAYFSSKTKTLVENRFKGTFTEIQNRIETYKSAYQKGFITLLVSAYVLGIIVAVIGIRFIVQTDVLTILITVVCGSIMFSGIIFNSMVLPVFGKSSVSVGAVLAVIAAEIVSYPFIAANVENAALGFFFGSLIGFAISTFYTLYLFLNFEFNMFNVLVKSQ